jgi:hypothetical protein
MRMSGRGGTYRIVATAAWAAALLVGALPARADIGVVLNDSVAHGVARVTGAGHSGVYFSRICPAGPVKLRLCAEGEEGSVISTYADFGEDEKYEWNIVPLSVYLYGVSDRDERPLFGSERIKDALEREYLQNSLASHCTAPECSSNDKGDWRAMVGATLIRTVYLFAVTTTVQQDAKFIEEFNQRPNDGHFNGFTSNCADFTRELINTYFPKATHRNYLNDFGMSSPKGIARSFVIFAHDNPELEFRVLHFPQEAGTIKRSSTARAGTEQLVRSKKLLLPVLLFEAPAAGISAVTYLLTGRFSAQRERERYPTVRAGELERQRQLALARKDAAAAEEWAAQERKERERILGSPEQWEQYREQFAGLVADAEQSGLIASQKALGAVFKSLDAQGRPVRDEDGRLWLELHRDGDAVRVGLTAETVVSEDSDPALAYRLMLARVHQALASSPSARPAMPEFAQDWSLLQQVREKIEVWQARTARK